MSSNQTLSQSHQATQPSASHRLSSPTKSERGWFVVSERYKDLAAAMKDEDLSVDYILVEPEVMPIFGGGVFQYFVPHPRHHLSPKAQGAEKGEWSQPGANISGVEW